MADGRFELGGQSIGAGERRRVDIPISLLSNHTGMNLSVEVINGKKPGPVLFVSGAVHGDEIIGVEIIRRLAHSPALRKTAGTLMLIPIVNVFGFISQSRYLPDRRDLNRSFPGTEKGSLASQLAHIFMREIAEKSDYGVDLHSGAVHRANLPQIRARLDKKDIKDLASAFGAPIVLNSTLRDGSLRQAAQDAGCAMLLYEAGEALRFDERAIRIGVKGVMNVMRRLDMLPAGKTKATSVKPLFSQSSQWLRAPIGGVMRAHKGLGESVNEGERVGVVSDPFGEVEKEITAKSAGVVIGRTNLPVVNRGDALFHVAKVFNPDQAGAFIGALEESIGEDPLFDDAEII